MSKEIEEYIKSQQEYEDIKVHIDGMNDGYVKNKLTRTMQEIQQQLNVNRGRYVTKTIQKFVYYNMLRNKKEDSFFKELELVIISILEFDQWESSTDDLKDSSDAHTCIHHFHHNSESLLMTLEQKQENDNQCLLTFENPHKDHELISTLTVNQDMVLNQQATNQYDRYQNVNTLYSLVHSMLQSYYHLPETKKATKTISLNDYSYSNLNRDVPMDGSSSSFLYPNPQRKSNNPLDADRLPGGILPDGSILPNGGSLLTPEMFKPKPLRPDGFPPGARFEPYGPMRQRNPNPLAKKPSVFPYSQLNPDNLEPPTDYSYTFY